MTRRLTQILVLVTLVILIVYDIVIRIEPTPDDTISEVMWTWVTQHPTVPVVLGVILGHWVWPPRKTGTAFGPAVLAVWGVILAIADIVGVVPAIQPIIPFIGGLVLGGWLWGPTHQDLKGTLK